MHKISPKVLIGHFNSDSLFRNSVFLMLSTLVQAVLGFLFWMLCARLFTPAEIGLGSTLIAGLTLIAYVSLFGFNDALIKYLPHAENRSSQINSSLILSALTALVVSIGYLLFTTATSPEFVFFKTNNFFVILFILLGIFSAVNLLTDSIFIACRKSQYNLLIYTLQSIVKLTLPIFFVSWGALGISSAVGIAAAIAFFLSVFFASRKLNYQPKLHIDRKVLKKSWRFSSATYLANLFNILPPNLLPLIIISQLGAESAGHFYIVFMIANLLYAIGYALCNSLFAEGSHGAGELRVLTTQAIKLWLYLALPVIALMALLAPGLLEVFGKSYGQEGQIILWILLVVAPLVYAYNLTNAILRIKGHTAAIIITNVVYAVTIVGLAWELSGRWGIIGIAVAWGTGHLLSALLSSLMIYRQLHR